MKKRKINSLYIHIPFCRNICPYCDFSKLIKNDKLEKAYILRLIEDLESVKNLFCKFKTIYIGGGTPSSLNLDNLGHLLNVLDKMHLQNNYEFTIESNPEDISEEFLRILKKHGINRISIGIQTFNKNILKSINRDYDIKYYDLIGLVKKYINNISLDFIYGLPGYTTKELEFDLSFFHKLNVNHASFYSLIISPGTIFFNKHFQECDSSISRDFYDLILKDMRENGFKRYEVSNFAKPGFESIHNLTYWNNDEYVAIGLASSGYVGNVRYSNTKNFSDYIKGNNTLNTEIVTKKLLEEYFLITKLRLEDGFSIVDYDKLFRKDFLEVNHKQILDLSNKGLVKINGDNFSCTDEGIMLLDEVLLKLIP